MDIALKTYPVPLTSAYYETKQLLKSVERS